MTAAAAWLARRVRGAPGSLRDEMESAAGRASDARPDAGLAAAGLERLRDVAAGGGDRHSAVALLAADALLTAAFEAAAEEGGAAEGVDAVEALAASLDVRRFEALLAGLRDA